MAFNNYKLNYPTAKIVVNQEDNEVKSILSDDQSSWVLFNPESDILSSTTQDRDDSTDSDLNSTQIIKTPNLSRQGTNLSEDDDLIDNLDPLNLDKYHKSYDRINDWNLNNDIVDDNVASWDLDEDLSNNTLDTSILKDFYGNELIKTLDKKDLIRFRQIHQTLKRQLSKKPPNPLIQQLLLRLYPQPNPQPLKMGYNRYLKATINSHYDYDELSDTASSSLVLCDGE